MPSTLSRTGSRLLVALLAGAVVLTPLAAVGDEPDRPHVRTTYDDRVPHATPPQLARTGRGGIFVAGPSTVRILVIPVKVRGRTDGTTRDRLAGVLRQVT